MKLKISKETNAIIALLKEETNLNTDCIISGEIPDYDIILKHAKLASQSLKDFIPETLDEVYDPTKLYGTNGVRDTTFVVSEMIELIALAVFTVMLTNHIAKAIEPYGYVKLYDLYKHIEITNKFRLFAKSMSKNSSVTINGIPAYETDSYLYGLICVKTASLRFNRHNASSINKIRLIINNHLSPMKYVTEDYLQLQSNTNTESFLELKYYLEVRYNPPKGIFNKQVNSSIRAIIDVLYEEIDTTIEYSGEMVICLKWLAYNHPLLEGKQALKNLLLASFTGELYQFQNDIESSFPEVYEPTDENLFIESCREEYATI